MGNKTFQIILIILLLVGSFSLGFLLSKKNYSSNKISSEKTYEDGWADAEKRMIKMGLVPDRKNMEIKSLVGTVVSTMENSLEVKTNPLSPFSNPDLDSRVVKINNKTKIYKILKKNSETYRKELDDFSNNQNKVLTSATGGGPSIYYKTEIDLSEIKEGDKVSIKSEDNISEEKEFLAIEVTVSE